MWVFGYGSLIWKIDFPYQQRLTGYIKGFARRFWQGSEDHRGIPGRPGRVVTLVPSDDPEEKVWGVAYEIPPSEEDSVRAHLNHREKGGYVPVSVTFHPQESSRQSFDLEIYIGTEENPYFLGPAAIQDIAEQIFKSEGPSGKNMDYLFQLASAMKELAPQVNDEHLYALESEVKRLCDRNMDL